MNLYFLRTMHVTRVKGAAALAAVIGAMAVFAGGRVLLGNLPDYYLIDWLPVYNFTVGALSLFVTAVLIWRRHRYAWATAVATLITHSVVMLILLTAYGAVVATDSLTAMTVRVTAWLIILFLLYSAREASDQPPKAQF
jgi:hypothetical protein